MSLLVIVGWTSAVAAQPTARMALTWSGPPGCPTTENVQARVDALLGGEASASSVGDVRASGQVERVESGFRLLLSMGVGSNPPSSRVIEARTCDELAGAAAIAIALLARSTIGGGSASSPGESTPASSTPDQPESLPPPSPRPHPNTTSSRKEPAAEAAPARVQFIADVPIGVAGWGSLPSTGVGLGAALGIRWKALRVTAGAQLWQPQTADVSGFATRFTLWSAGAEACLTRTVHGLELGPCLGASVKRLGAHGVASAVFSAKSRTAAWVSGAGGLFLSLPTHGFAHLRFFGEATVLVSPRRPRFVIDQLGPVHEPALAEPQVGLGCEWIF